MPSPAPSEQSFLGTAAATVRAQRRGFVLIASGIFGCTNADTLVEEWRPVIGGENDPTGIDGNDRIRRALSRIAYAPDNVVVGSARLLRKLNNLDHDDEDGITTGMAIDDAPVEVLYLEAPSKGSLA